MSQSSIPNPPSKEGGGTVLTVIAPCFNEADNIDMLVDRMIAVFDRINTTCMFLLIDDGSKDETWSQISKRSASDPRIFGLRHKTNQGIVGAWRSGLSAAGGELVCLIDADLQNRPEDIVQLYHTYLQELPDIVQGVRHAVAGARSRQLFSRGLNLLLNLTFRVRLRDNKSGFVLGRAGVLADLLRHRYRYKYFQCFIGAAAATRGLTIAQVDTVFDRRHAGQSFLSHFPIWVSLRTLWELIKYRVETWVPDESRGSASSPASSSVDGWIIPSHLTDTVGGDV